MTTALETASAYAIEFRRALDTRPPLPVASATQLRRGFDGPTPERGQKPEDVIDALVRAAEPGLLAIPGRRFFGWVMGASHEAGVAADWLTSAWGQNAGLYAASPAAAMAEEVSARWLLDILRLPEESSVGFVTGATMANFTCLAAARSEVLARAGWDVEADGLQGAPRVRLFAGADAHATVLAAFRYLGFGAASVRLIPTDEEGSMSAAALAAALAEAEGPAIVAMQAGQINTGAFDPAEDIAAICAAHRAWLHVDGAFGLWARAVEEFSALTNGLERADSWATDGHKWLQLPFDTGFAIVRDPRAHRRAMTVSASYLPEAPREFEPSHYAPELSRRARGFASWVMLRTLGRAGVADMVRRHCALAQRLAKVLDAVPGVAVENDVRLNQVIVSFGENDEMTRQVIAQLQHDNTCFAAGAQWRGRWVMRLPVIAAGLDIQDIDRLAAAITAAWRRVEARAASKADKREPA